MPVPAAAAAAAVEGAVASGGSRDQQHAQSPAVGAGGRPEGELRFPDSFYDGEGRLALKNLTLPQLEAWCASIGEDGPKRALQLWRFMYYDRQWVRSLEDAAAEHVQNGFSRAFLLKATPLATLDAGLRLQSVARAADGTRKMVFGLAFGPAAGGQVGLGGSWGGSRAQLRAVASANLPSA
jgi:23S rRNA (adenine2503-C2)-methyltransferase